MHTHSSLRPWIISFITVLAFLCFKPTDSLKAQNQNIQTVVGSVVNGSITGTTLVTATWMIQDDNSTLTLNKLSKGIGAGILAGIGVGILDVVQAKSRNGYYVNGVFNTAKYRSTLITLDTFYGAAGGAIISSSFVLMSDNKDWSQVRRGMGIGAWVGFAFGIIDAYSIANDGYMANSGGFSMNNLKSYEYKNMQLSWLNANVVELPNLETGNKEFRPTVEALRFKLSF